MSEQENNIEQNKKNGNEEKLAVKFPEWDLIPPDLLIKRSNNEQ